MDPTEVGILPVMDLFECFEQTCVAKFWDRSFNIAQIKSVYNASREWLCEGSGIVWSQFDRQTYAKVECSQAQLVASQLFLDWHSAWLNSMNSTIWDGLDPLQQSIHHQYSKAHMLAIVYDHSTEDTAPLHKPSLSTHTPKHTYQARCWVNWYHWLARRDHTRHHTTRTQR